MPQTNLGPQLLERGPHLPAPMDRQATVSQMTNGIKMQLAATNASCSQIQLAGSNTWSDDVR
jgi:hypothetical protein